MAKQIMPLIKFNRTDAPKPMKVADGTLSIRMPFPLTLHPQATAKIDFGLSCNHALIVTRTIGEIDKYVFEINKPIVVTLRNPSFTDDIVLDSGSTVVNVAPIFIPDFDVG